MDERESYCLGRSAATASRTCSTKTSGFSSAAKCPPSSASLNQRSVPERAASLAVGQKSSFGNDDRAKLGRWYFGAVRNVLKCGLRA